MIWLRSNTLHAVGAELPTKLHGWDFDGSEIVQADDGSPVLIARWKRPLKREARQ
jgi:hypothetical protein